MPFSPNTHRSSVDRFSYISLQKMLKTPAARNAGATRGPFLRRIAKRVADRPDDDTLVYSRNSETTHLKPASIRTIPAMLPPQSVATSPQRRRDWRQPAHT